MSDVEEFENMVVFSNREIADQEAECQYLRSKIRHMECKIKSLEMQITNSGSKKKRESTDTNEITELRNTIELLSDQNQRFHSQIDEFKTIIRQLLIDKKSYSEDVKKMQKLLELQAPLSNLDLESSEASENSASMSEGLRQAVQFAIQQQNDMKKLKDIIDTQNAKIRNLYTQLKSLPVAMPATPAENYAISVNCSPVAQCNEQNVKDQILLDPLFATIDLNAMDNSNIVICNNADGINQNHILVNFPTPDLYTGGNYQNINTVLNNVSGRGENVGSNNQNNGINYGFIGFDTAENEVVFNQHINNDNRRNSDPLTLTNNNQYADIFGHGWGQPQPTQTNQTFPIRICPVCSKTKYMSESDFEFHVNICITENSIELSTLKICPVCQEQFGDLVDQTEFEMHVEHHFSQIEEEVHYLAT